MNRHLHTARPAAEELAAAVGWYEDRRAGLGSELFDAIERTLNRITMPKKVEMTGTPSYLPLLLSA